MSDLSIAASGLAAQQMAMDTVAENLANANTPGYVSESAILSAVPALGGQAGGGVEVTGVATAGNALLQAATLSASSAQGAAEVSQQVLSGVQSYFPEPGQNGISAQLAAFWSSWDNVASNPSDLASRTVVVSDAQQISSSLNQAASQLQQAYSQAASQLADTVDQASSELAQVAALNTEVVAGTAAGQNVSALVDRRNQILGDLAGSIGANVTYSSDGSATVYVGGSAVVQAGSAVSLTLASAGGSPTVTVAGTGQVLAVQGGTAGGLLGVLGSSIPSYQAQLDTVANDLAQTVNDQLAAGYTANGTPGSAYPMFVASSGPITAATIEVNPAVVSNPQQLAAASSPPVPPATTTNDGSNAQAIAELYNAPTGPDAAYRSFIGKLGSDVQAATSSQQTADAAYQAANTLEQSVSGVSPDQQMVEMVQFQQAYEASAKIVSTAQAMVQSLLASVA